jgi:hypothetical protein
MTSIYYVIMKVTTGNTIGNSIISVPRKIKSTADIAVAANVKED